MKVKGMDGEAERESRERGVERRREDEREAQRKQKCGQEGDEV